VTTKSGNSISRVILVLSFLCFAYVLINTLLGQFSIYNESSLLTNVVLEYANHNNFIYPLHGQKYLFSGIETFIIHPPLQYILSAFIVKWLGFGIPQIYLVSTIVALIGVGLGMFYALRYAGFIPSFLIPVLVVTSFRFYYYALNLRPDLTMGFFFFIASLLLFQACKNHKVLWQQYLFSFFLGLVCMLSIAAHWNGVCTFLLIPVYLLLLKKYDYAWIKLCQLSIFVILGVSLILIPWVMLYQNDFLPGLRAIFFAGTTRVVLDNITNGLPYLFKGLFYSIDGIVLYLGVLFSLLFYFFENIQSRLNKDKSGEESFTFFPNNLFNKIIIFSFIYYAIFFSLALWHRNPQYMANVYFHSLYLSALGYYCCIQLLTSKATKYKTAFKSFLMIILIIIVCQNPLTYKRFFHSHNPFVTSINFNDFTLVANRFNDFFDNETNIIMGAHTYPYLYNKKYTGVFEVFGKLFFNLDELKNKSALDKEKQIFNERKQYYPRELTAQQRIKSLEGVGDAMALTFHTYGFQSLYVTEDVWRGLFKNVAIVRTEDGRFHHLFYRSEKLENYPTTAPHANSVEFIGNNLFVVFDPWNQRETKPNFLNWYNKLCECEQEKVLHSFMEQHHWFQLPNANSSRKNKFIHYLLIAISKNRLNSLNSQKTLEHFTVDNIYRYRVMWHDPSKYEKFQGKRNKQENENNPCSCGSVAANSN